mgnify:CR=1 FL=1
MMWLTATHQPHFGLQPSQVIIYTGYTRIILLCKNIRLAHRHKSDSYYLIRDGVGFRMHHKLVLEYLSSGGIIKNLELMNGVLHSDFDIQRESPSVHRSLDLSYLNRNMKLSNNIDSYFLKVEKSEFMPSKYPNAFSG